MTKGQKAPAKEFDYAKKNDVKRQKAHLQRCSMMEKNDVKGQKDKRQLQGIR